MLQKHLQLCEIIRTTWVWDILHWSLLRFVVYTLVGQEFLLQFRSLAIYLAMFHLWYPKPYQIYFSDAERLLNILHIMQIILSIYLPVAVCAIFVWRYSSLMLIPLCLDNVGSRERVFSPNQLWSLNSCFFRKSCPLVTACSIWFKKKNLISTKKLYFTVIYHLRISIL